MPRNSELNVAELSGEAAIAGEIPAFDLDHDMGAGASAYGNESHVIDIEATQIKPVKRKKVGLIVALAATAIVATMAIYLHSRRQNAAAAQNPDLAAIIQEAKSVPPLAGRKLTALSPAPNAAPRSDGQAAKVAPKAQPTEQPHPASSATVATAVTATPMASVQAAIPAASSTPRPAAEASPAAPTPPPGNSVVSKVEYEAVLKQRDALNKKLQDAEAKSSKVNAEPSTKKEIVKIPVPERSTFTVKAVLADGVVLEDARGKLVVAPAGAKVVVDGKAMALSR